MADELSISIRNTGRHVLVEACKEELSEADVELLYHVASACSRFYSKPTMATVKCSKTMNGAKELARTLGIKVFTGTSPHRDPGSTGNS